MPQTIGVAGWQPFYPENFSLDIPNLGHDNCGNVIAMTKNITVHDLVFDTTTHSQEPFARLFVNCCLWASRPRSTSLQAWLFSTGNDFFDTTVANLLNDCNIFVQNIGPWHSTWSNSNIPKNYQWINDCYNIPSPDLYILMPSFNALGATQQNDRRMDDQLQSRVYDDVVNKKSGLFISEWFHFLHSQPNRQTFYNSSNPAKSLYTLSPFILPNATPSVTDETPLAFVDTERAFFSRVIEDDTMSKVLPSSFEIIMSPAEHSPYNGEYTNVYEVQPACTIFWTCDTVQTDVVVDRTTPPPLPEPTNLSEIHMEIAKILVPKSCGPFNMYLDGPYQNYFSLENNKLFLTREPSERIQMPITVVAEDHFVPPRFEPISETHIVNFDKCDAAITLPLDGSGPAFSHRKCNACGNMWGSNNDDNISIVPFTEWAFSGEGSAELPAMAYLRGQHCDTNVLWLQVNAPGTYTVIVEADTELGPNQCVNPFSKDYGYFYVIQNTINDAPVTPEQHESLLDIFDNDLSTAYYYSSSIGNPNVPWSGKIRSVKIIDIPDPNETDGEDNRVRGDIFFALVFKKGCFTSSYSDQIKLTAYRGLKTTPKPEDVEVNIKVNNFLENSSLAGFDNPVQIALYDEFISATKIGKPGESLFTEDFTITALNGLNISNLILTHDNNDLISSLNWAPQGSASVNKNIYASFVGGTFPPSDEAVTINVSGTLVTTTTTTTTTCPPCDLNLSIVNNLNDVYFRFDGGPAYRKTDNDLEVAINICEGSQKSTNVNYYTENGKIYVNPDKPIASYISGETLAVAVVRQTNTTGYIQFTWDGSDCETGTGYDSKYEITNDPSSTTTTTTTTEPPFCDDEINIFCEQTLKCVPNPNDPSECIPDLQLSSQRLIAVTCCTSLSDTEILTRVFDFFNLTYGIDGSQLEDIPALSSSCPSSVSSAFGDCAFQDSSGECNDTILTLPISINNNGQTVIYCTPAAENPLP